MRTCFTVLLSCICLLSLAQGRWQWLNPTPSGDANKKIVFTDAANGFLFNSYGELFRTRDRGLGWTLEQRFASGTCMDYKDGTLVIGGGDGSVHVSSDLGASWTVHPTDPGSGYGIVGVDMISADTLLTWGVVGSGVARLYRSDDRGRSWTSVSVPPGGMQTYAVEFISSKLGFVGAWGTVFRTRDGGASWQGVNDSRFNGLLTCIKFYDTQTGYALRDSLLKTTDGGTTWKNTELSPPEDIYSLFFVDSSYIFLAGAEGVSFRTADAGAHWEWIGATGLTDRTHLFGQHFFDERRGFQVGMRGRIWRTDDAGDTWTDQSPTFTDITSLSFASDSIGYAAEWHRILKTTDAGKTWTPLAFTPADPNEFLRYIHFTSPDTGYVTDGRLRLHRTTDGGATWSRITFPWYFDGFVSASFTRGVIYLSVTGSGHASILRSTDAGSSWTEVNNNYPTPNFNYRNLHFVDPQTGYGTSGGYLYKTTDSARTWTKVFQSNDVMLYTFNSVHFVNAATGYVAGDDAYVARTADSGRTWKRIPIGQSNYGHDILTINFFNAQVGYLVNAYGELMQTVDSGYTWRPYRRTYAVQHIGFTGDSSVYLAGSYGAILKKSLADFTIDSLQVNNLTPCSGAASAVVSALWSTVDSVWLEYGTGNFERRTAAQPGIANGRAGVRFTLEGLAAATAYRFRLGLQYSGRTYYSDVHTFTTPGIAVPTITFNNPTSFCTGGSVNLFSSIPSGVQWYRDGVALAGATGSSYSATQGGSYTVGVVQGACPVVPSAPVTVRVDPYPPVPTITTAGGVLTSSAPAGNQWYVNGAVIPGATEQQYRPSAAGQYYVRVTVGACSNQSAPYNYVVTEIVGPEAWNGEVAAYPNPVAGKLFIRNSQGRRLLLQLVDATGKKLREYRVQQTAEVLELKDLPAGIYTLLLTDTKKKETIIQTVIKL